MSLRAIPDLLIDLLNEFTNLVRTESDLARTGCLKT